MSNVAARRPFFVDEISLAHHAGLARGVVLTGNIHDLFPVAFGDAIRFVPVETTIHRTLTQARYPGVGGSEHFIVVTLNSQGISFHSPDDLAELGRLAVLIEASPSDPELTELSRKLMRVLSEQIKRTAALPALALAVEFLRTLASIRGRGIRVRPVAVIFDHADATFPDREMGALSTDDREALKLVSDLLRDEAIWADVETAQLRPDLVILLSPTRREINQRILSLPKTVHVEIGLPSAEDRHRLLGVRLESAPVTLEFADREDSLQALVQHSRGLTIRALDDLVTWASRASTPVTRKAVLGEVNRELSARLGNLIRMVEPEHDLSGVVGFDKLKRRLAQVERRMDDPKRAPAGMVVVGPNGSGKTFNCEAFAAHTGRVAMTLSPVRGPWLGQTDVLADRLQSVLSAFGRTLVVVDEAHLWLGARRDRAPTEAEARFARTVIQMMDDESNRSNIVWALVTTRPDRLNPELVRRGRCPLFVPIFDPEGEDAEAFLQWLVRELAEAGVRLDESETRLLRERSRGFSAADYRTLIDDFREEKAFDPELVPTEFLHRWTPNASIPADERELQVLQAALHCDWPELLPDRLRQYTRDQLRSALERPELKRG